MKIKELQEIRGGGQTALRLLVAAAGALCLSVSPPTFAQDGADDDALEEIVVTGSRITRTEFGAPTPLQIFDDEDIEYSAETNVGEFLNQLPSLGEATFNRTSTGFAVAGAGRTTADLRDLDESRTLTLVNGRRHVAGVPGDSAVDFNAIPSALVERVEVITGGASAVYGSDAIAGVVNFIYKTDFEGFDLRTRYGAHLDEGDDETSDISLLIGSNFDNDRGNAVLFLGHTDRGSVLSRDRDRTKLDAGANRSNPLGPRVIPQCSSGPPQGRFDIDGARGGTGANWTYDQQGNLQNSFRASGETDCENGFNRSFYRTIAIPTRRRLVGTNVHWDLNDNTRFFAESTWIRTSTKSVIEPFFLNVEDAFPSDDVNVDAHGMFLNYPDSAGNMIKNPFIPAELLAEIINIENSRAMNSQLNPAHPNYQAPHSGYLGIVRRLVEFGPRTADAERRTTRIVVGLEGQFKDWDWDLSYNYGQTTQEQISGGRIDLNALRNALLAEEDPDYIDPTPATRGDDDVAYRCVDSVARGQGCVPIDLFGGMGSIGPVNTIRGMRDPRPYITADASLIANIEQRILQGNITGDLFDLPAGPVGVALGFESRKEKSADDRDALTARGLSSGNAIPSVRGRFDVDEYYAEVAVPIVGDGPVSLDFGAAMRISDYSIIGDVTSWEARLELGIEAVPGLKIRLAHAEPVRSPNIDELFAAAGETFAQVNDVCTGVKLTGDDPQIDDEIEASCRNDAAVQARLNNPIPTDQQASAGDGFQLTQAELQGTSGLIGEGNMTLQEETGITTTVGATYDFTIGNAASGYVAIDWFDMTVEDAISTVSQNNTVDLCYKGPSDLSHPLCSNIERFPNGPLKQVDTQFINVAEITTKGIDVLGELNWELGSGSLALGLNYTWLDEYNFSPGFGGAVDTDAGEIGNAEHKLNGSVTWRPNDRWSLYGQVRYISESRLDNNSHSDTRCAGYADGCEIDAVYYTDLRVSYKGDWFGEGSEVYLGLENALDEDPPILGAGLSGAGGATGTETNADVYDAIGRRWYMGFRLSL